MITLLCHETCLILSGSQNQPDSPNSNCGSYLIATQAMNGVLHKHSALPKLGSANGVNSRRL